MTQVIKDVVNWLTQWFYTKDEIDTDFALKTEIPTSLDPTNHQIPTATSSARVNINTYYNFGFYYYNGTGTTEMQYVTNLPTGMGYKFVMIVEKIANNYAKQTITDLNTGNTYIRVRWNGSWKSWKRIAYVD